MGSGTIADMLAGNTYVNIRSNPVPAGEIRGQLALVTPEPASVGLVLLPLVVGVVRRRGCGEVG